MAIGAVGVLFAGGLAGACGVAGDLDAGAFGEAGIFVGFAIGAADGGGVGVAGARGFFLAESGVADEEAGAVGVFFAAELAGAGAFAGDGDFGATCVTCVCVGVSVLTTDRIVVCRAEADLAVAVEACISGGAVFVGLAVGRAGAGAFASDLLLHTSCGAAVVVALAVGGADGFHVLVAFATAFAGTIFAAVSWQTVGRGVAASRNLAGTGAATEGADLAASGLAGVGVGFAVLTTDRIVLEGAAAAGPTRAGDAAEAAGTIGVLAAGGAWR